MEQLGWQCDGDRDAYPLVLDDATRSVLADVAADARSQLADYGHDLNRPRHPLETVEEREQDRESTRAYADRLLDALSADRLAATTG